MTTKYLEIDSTYRDRSLWPLQANFQVLLSQTSAADAASATDPVAEATPLVAWQSNRFQMNSFNSPSISGTVISTGYGATNNSFVVVFSAPAGQLQTLNNYYAHSVLTAPGNVESRVVSYQYLGNNEAQVTLASPVSLPPGTTISMTDPTDLSVLKLFVPGSPALNNFYAGKILYDETINAGVSITNYDAVTGTISVASPIPGWSLMDSFDIRSQLPTLTGNVVGGSNSSTVGLGPNPLTNLVGSFVRLEPTYPSSNPNGEIRRIISYDPTTFMATVFSPFTSIVPPSSKYEILTFSRNNPNPFIFTGTRQEEFIIYSVKLLNLVLPNLTLATGYGGTVKNYPYVYVQLTPLNLANDFNISSNNPNSVAMLFRATKRHDHDDESFVQFSGNGMIQKQKFKTETNFHFSIHLPNGQLFQTIITDTTSPSIPNPLIQISAMFEISRS